MYFLVFEGLDGSGKSTLMGRLKAHLEADNKQVVMTREPGGTDLGDRIRDMLLATDHEAPTAKAELLLYEASRAQHVENVIRPALQAGKWVLCDRFTASSIAFQGGGRGISLSEVEWLNSFATSDLQSHLTVLVDLSWDECLRRQKGRESMSGQGKDRIESEDRSFHEKVRQSFLKQAHENSETWFVVDGSLSPEQLHDCLLSELRRRGWLDS